MKEAAEDHRRVLCRAVLLPPLIDLGKQIPMTITALSTTLQLFSAHSCAKIMVIFYHLFYRQLFFYFCGKTGTRGASHISSFSHREPTYLAIRTLPFREDVKGFVVTWVTMQLSSSLLWSLHLHQLGEERSIEPDLPVIPSAHLLIRVIKVIRTHPFIISSLLL